MQRALRAGWPCAWPMLSSLCLLAKVDLFGPFFLPRALRTLSCQGTGTLARAASRQNCCSTSDPVTEPVRWRLVTNGEFHAFRLLSWVVGFAFGGACACRRRPRVGLYADGAVNAHIDRPRCQDCLRRLWSRLHLPERIRRHPPRQDAEGSELPIEQRLNQFRRGMVRRQRRRGCSAASRCCRRRKRWRSGIGRLPAQLRTSRRTLHSLYPVLQTRPCRERAAASLPGR